jgi:DNA-directed RNA polymerase sigma subunit (sigma70/sigma32)
VSAVQDRKQPEVINTDWHATHAEVGEVLGISRQAAQQLERRALDKLRQGLSRRGYPAADVIEALSHLDGARW